MNIESFYKKYLIEIYGADFLFEKFHCFPEYDAAIDLISIEQVKEEKDVSKKLRIDNYLLNRLIDTKTRIEEYGCTIEDFINETGINFYGMHGNTDSNEIKKDEFETTEQFKKRLLKANIHLFNSFNQNYYQYDKLKIKQKMDKLFEKELKKTKEMEIILGEYNADICMLPFKVLYNYKSSRIIKDSPWNIMNDHVIENNAKQVMANISEFYIPRNQAKEFITNVRDLKKFDFKISFKGFQRKSPYNNKYGNIIPRINKAILTDTISGKSIKYPQKENLGFVDMR